MPRILSEAQVTQFRELGYVAGIPVLSPAEAATALESLRAWERQSGKSVKQVMRGKAHLLLKCLSDLVHHPRVVAAADTSQCVTLSVNRQCQSPLM